MAFQDDFNSAQEPEQKGFDLIPEGEYEAIIDDSSLDLTKTPARLSLTYKLIGTEHKNRKLWSNYNMAGQGLGFLKKDLKTLGLDYSNVKSEQDIAKLVFGRIGQGVTIYVAQKEWKGKMYNNAYLNKAESAPTTKSNDLGF